MGTPGFVKKFRLNGLRSQLILGIASILVVLMSLLVIELMSRQRNFFLKLNHDRAFGLSSTLASTADSYVISYELAGLQKLVSTYKNNPGLQYAIVLSDDGIVLAHTDEKYLGQQAIDSISERLKPVKTTQTLIENNSILDVASPIIDHDKIVGWARIGLSQEYIEPNLTAIRKNGLLFILISLIVGSIFAILIAGRLSSGLQKLITAAERIKGGNRDVRVGHTNSFETSQLGTAFNQMLDEISSNEKLLSMVLQNMPVGIWILDEHGNIVSGNPAGKDMWKGIEYVGMEQFNMYKGWFTETGKELEAHEWGAAIALREGRPVLDQEIEIECFDKSHKIILNSAMPLRDANEKIIGAIAINVDITDRKNAEDTLRKTNHAIGERVKELNCLYRLSELSNDPLKTIEHILQECADIIPPSYQYPDITCARIVFNGQIFESASFRESNWKQTADIINKGVIIGKVSVFYTEQTKDEDEGPFLKEERFLINSIADILESSAERRNAEAIIKEQVETFSAIIEYANDSIWLLSPDLKILQYNKTGRERLEMSRGKKIHPGADFKEFLHPNTESVFMPMFNAALAGEYTERESYQADVQGRMFWLRTKMYPIYDTQKKLIGITVLAENITARKKVETELEQSEEKNRALVENITDAIILMDEKLKPIYRSPSVTKIIGFSLKEMMSRTVFDLVHPDEKQRSRDLFQKASFNPGVPMQGQFRVLHKNGNYIWVEGTVMNMLDNKSIRAIILNYRDITERKRFEEQQLLITSIVNSTDDAIISKTLGGIITSWNRGAENILGYLAEEVVGKHISIIVPPQLSGEEDIIIKSVSGGNSVDHFETRRRRKNGKLIDVSLTVSPITDSEGKIIGASKILRDITERKKAEESIKQSEANYRQLFDNSPAPMWVIDEKTSLIIRVNQACIRNYGYSEEEFFGMAISDISPHHPVSPSKTKNMSDLFFMGSQQHVKKSGELIDVITSSIPVKLNDEKSILLIAIDVTEKNLYEQKLTKAAIKVQEEERYEIGGELHDNVCQLLAGSLMFLAIIKRSLPEQAIEMYDRAHQTISMATDEIRNLSHRLAPAFFDKETLEEVLRRLLETFNVENNYTTSLNVSNKIRERSLSHDLQLNLYRILQEQLRNIMKHAKASDIAVGITLKDNTLQMRIKDNGIGFDTKVGKGGIGLANMNRRVQLFSGSFMIHSSVGNGCEVLVDIPLNDLGSGD